MMRSHVTESVTRRTYWVGVAVLMALMIVLAAWAGLYRVESPEARPGPAIENTDPLVLLMYSPLGMAIVLLVLQFLAANVLFWLGAASWHWLRRRRAERQP